MKSSAKIKPNASPPSTLVNQGPFPKEVGRKQVVDLVRVILVTRVVVHVSGALCDDVESGPLVSIFDNFGALAKYLGSRLLA